MLKKLLKKFSNLFTKQKNLVSKEQTLLPVLQPPKEILNYLKRTNQEHLTVYWDEKDKRYVVPNVKQTLIVDKRIRNGELTNTDE